MPPLKNELFGFIKSDPAIFDYIQESAFDGLWYWDLESKDNSKSIWMNDKFWNLLGFSENQSEISNKSWMDFISPNNQAEIQNKLNLHINNIENKFDYISSFIKADGKVIWLKNKAISIRNASAKSIRIIGVITDITWLKEKEEILERCNTEAKIGYWEYDLISNSIFWSKVCKDIHGVSQDYIPNLEEAVNFFEKPESFDKINSLVKSALEKGISYEEELIIITKNGERKWTKTIGIPQFHKGKCIRLYGTFQDIHEKKLNALALKENERKFKGIFNSTFSFIGFMDPQGVLLEANQTALEFADLKPEDVIGKNFWDCYWWQISEETKLNLKNKIEQASLGVESVYEVEVWGKNKSPLTILFSLRPIFDSKGNVIYIIPEGRPIQEIVDTRTRYKSVIEGTNVGTWEWNVQTGETIFNERWAEIIGYTLDELKPISINTWASLAHPDDLDESNRKLQLCFDKKEEFYECECRMKHKNGEWIWVFDRGKVFSWTDDGKPLMMFGTHQEINTRKKSEERLRQSEQAFRGNFENAAIGMALLNENAHFTKTNLTLNKILGRNESELLNKNLFEFCPISDQNENLEWFNEIKESASNNFQIEKKFIHTDGKVIHTIIALSVVRKLDNSPLYYICQIIDISKIKEGEKEIINLLKVTNDQNERLKNFAYIVSHNMRSHTGAMNMLLELIEDEHPDIFDNEMVKLLKQSSDSLTETVKHLLEVVEINLNSNKNLESINLLKAVENNLNGIKSLFNNESFEVNVNIPSNISVMAYPAYLDSIILNFITNSIKYKNPDVEPNYLNISAIEIDHDVQIFFDDNGLGFNLKRDGEKLFGLYKTFHKGKNSKGIGLFITKNQIEAIGGSISVESEELKGTKFIINLKNGRN